MKKFSLDHISATSTPAAVNPIQPVLRNAWHFFLIIFFFMFSGFAAATDFSVTTNLDAIPALPASLRQALLDVAADPSPGPHKITFFNITSPQTVNLVDSLPTIDKQVSFVEPFNLGTITGAANISALRIGATGDVTIGSSIEFTGAQNENAGVLSLATPTTFNIENYTQLASGTLNIGFGANCLNDTLAANGVVALGGNLKISQATCKPALNTVFTIILNGKKTPVQGIFSGLAEGSEIVVGEYKYKISYKGGAGNDVTLTVTGVPGTQTINFPSIGAKNIGDTATLAAAASSTLPIVYINETPAVCTVSGLTASFGPNAGICKITATQAGGNVNGTQYAAAPPVTQSIAVNGVPAMVLTPANLDFGSQAIGTSVTKTVTVKNNGTADLTVVVAPINQANSDYTQVNTCTAPLPPPQTCTISVTFKPSASGARTGGLGIAPNAGAAQSVPLTGIGTLNPQTITNFGPLANKIYGDAPFSVTATGGASGNPVTFTSVTGSVCSATLTGTVTILTVGTCTVAANQAASGSYSAAVEVRQSFVVALAAQVFTALPTPDPAIKNYIGESIIFTPAASSGLPVLITITSTAVCSKSVAANNLTTITFNAAGNCTFIARQDGKDASGNQNYTDVSLTIIYGVANKIGITLSLNPVPIKVFGDTPFTLSVKSDGPLNPITFTPSTTPLVCTMDLPTSQVTIIKAGVCTIPASMKGGKGFENVVDQPLSFTIGLAAQAIVKTPLQIPGQAFSYTSIKLSATGGSSGNAVVLTSKTPTVCDLNAAKTAVELKTAGACTIEAAQLGIAEKYAPALANWTFNITPVAQVITLTQPADFTFGDKTSVDVIATGGASKSPVVLTASPAGVCTIAATTVTIVGAGDCNVTANQDADGGYTKAAAVTKKFTINPKAQVIDFKQPIVPVFTTDPQKLLATSNNPANPIVFSTTTPLVCTVNDAAQTVTLKIAGDCVVKANQAAVPNYLAAEEKSQIINTLKLLQTITFATTTPAEKTFGDAKFDISATGGASGMPVTFTALPAAVCTLAGNSVTIVGAGDCLISASQAGNDNYNPATGSKTVKIAQKKQLILLDAPTNKTFGDAAFTVSATGGASDLPITFSTASASCTVSGNIVTINGAGDCIVAADQAGNINYLAAVQEKKTIVIAKAAQLITFADLPAKTFGDPAISLGATSSSGLPVAYTSLNTITCEVAQNVVTIKASGTCRLLASQAGDGNYEKAADVEKVFNVSQAAGSVITFSPQPAILPKAGEPVTLQVTINGVGGVPAKGNVIFYDNGKEIGKVDLDANGVASFTTTALAGGNHSITAQYSGDANNKPVTSDPFGVPVLVLVTVVGGGGSSGGSGGGGGCAIYPQSDTRGGVDPTLPLLFIGAIVYFNRKNMNKIKYLLTLIPVISGFTPPAMAAEPGFYVGAGLGKSNTEGDNFDFNERLKREGFSGVNTTLKFNAFAWKLFGGYQVNPYFAVEGAYVSLGKATSTAETTLDPARVAAFADAIAKVQPRLAKGAALSVVGSMPLNPKFFAYAKLGAFRWNAEVGTSTGSINTLRTSKGNGTLLSIGGEAELGSGWAARGEVERYLIKPDPANVFSLNLLYRF
jgi:Bacterial Ig-like domain (group 3)/OmpA-like transmembrane domain/Abnormal spindle-like microcephaly-assoc'd, ASPM-SPD-2-Hydin